MVELLQFPATIRASYDRIRPLHHSTPETCSPFLQAARAALHTVGIRPPHTTWGHEFIQAQFVGELINRRKVYPASLRDTLARSLILRQLGDYEPDMVSQTQAERTLRRTHDFVKTLVLQGGEAS